MGLRENNILIPEYKIKRRVRELAEIISNEHKNSNSDLPPVMICILNGSFLFFSDLVQEMEIDVEIDFLRAKSYNGKDNSQGVKILKDTEINLEGKRIYVIEDLIDTGNTMEVIIKNLQGKNPKEIKIVTLVHRKNSVHKVDYTGFEINDEFIHGYGLDQDGLKRNYRNIYK